jgi:hypothetical protein
MVERGSSPLLQLLLSPTPKRTLRSGKRYGISIISTEQLTAHQAADMFFAMMETSGY